MSESEEIDYRQMAITHQRLAVTNGAKLLIAESKVTQLRSAAKAIHYAVQDMVRAGEITDDKLIIPVEAMMKCNDTIAQEIQGIL